MIFLYSIFIFFIVPGKPFYFHFFQLAVYLIKRKFRLNICYVFDHFSAFY